jgi:Methyltransferase FkbM domain
MTRVDYMTIDTEGSELEIVLDFPWNDFDIRVIQIEQLVEKRYPAQAGKKQAIIQHLTSSKFNYKLLGVYEVARDDTDDLIFARNLNDYLQMTNYMIGTSPKMHEE